MEMVFNPKSENELLNEASRGYSTTCKRYGFQQVPHSSSKARFINFTVARIAVTPNSGTQSQVKGH